MDRAGFSKRGSGGEELVMQPRRHAGMVRGLIKWLRQFHLTHPGYSSPVFRWVMRLGSLMGLSLWIVILVLRWPRDNSGHGWSWGGWLSYYAPPSPTAPDQLIERSSHTPSLESPVNEEEDCHEERLDLIQELDGELISKNSFQLEIRNKRLRVVDLPNDLGHQVPLLVYLHGFGGQLSQWRDQMEYFYPMANQLAIDLVGHGLSEAVVGQIDEYSVMSMVDDVHQILSRYEAAHLHNVVIVSHSFGTLVGRELAVRLPHLIRGLVLVAPLSAPSDLSHGRSSSWLTRLPSGWLDKLRQFDRRGGIDSVSVHRVLHHPTASTQTKQRQFYWNKLSRSTTVQSMLLASAAYPNLTRDIHRKLRNVPLLVVGGHHDRLVSADSINTLYQSIHPQRRRRRNDHNASSSAVVYFADCGHSPMVEHPNRFNNLLKHFIRTSCQLHLPRSPPSHDEDKLLARVPTVVSPLNELITS